jgi:hypothetical protein
MSDAACQAYQAYVHILEARIAELESENRDTRRIPEELYHSVNALMVDVPPWKVDGVVQKCSRCEQICYTYGNEQCDTYYHVFGEEECCNACTLKLLREHAFTKPAKPAKPRKSHTLIAYLRDHVYDAQIAELLMEAYTDAQIAYYFGSRWLRKN